MKSQIWSAGKRIAYGNSILIAMNAMYFLYLEITGSTEDVYFMYEKGAMYAPAVLQDGEYYRLITAMFMHFGIRHIINNMLVLFVLGGYLERALGHIKYPVFYLLCGIGSNLVSMFMQSADTVTVSAGASGAIFGVVGGLLYAVVINRGRLEDLSARQMILMILFSLYLGLNESGVDNIAHVSGLVIGFLLAILFYHRPTAGRWRNGGINHYEGL